MSARRKRVREEPNTRARLKTGPGRWGWGGGRVGRPYDGSVGGGVDGGVGGGLGGVVCSERARGGRRAANDGEQAADSERWAGRWRAGHGATWSISVSP